MPGFQPCVRSKAADQYHAHGPGCAGPSALDDALDMPDPWRCHGLVCDGPSALREADLYHAHGPGCAGPSALREEQGSGPISVVEMALV